jgi:signal transduction histidine kinase
MRRRKTAIFFLVLGICLIVLAAVLNVGWILLNLREVVLLILGVVFFLLIITGLTLNTIFLFREIRRNEQHDAFLNSVTHELKTPIASIKLYLETLKSRNVDDAKRREFYNVMLADTDRLLGTVEQVLQASSTREKSRPPHISEIDLRELVGDSIRIVEQRRHLDGDSIKFSKPAEPVVVSGDNRELQTAFTNLLENAVKYSIGPPKISVRIKTSALKRAEVFIKDNGVGIPPGELKRVFKRFYRVPVPELPDTKGTGLGLFIVKTIVEKHGGRVRAESRGDGKGSTFLVQLPLA